MSKADGLKLAAEICRSRETGWRQLAEQGGNEMFPEVHARLRAWEAMTCAEMIEEIAEAETDNAT